MLSEVLCVSLMSARIQAEQESTEWPWKTCIEETLVLMAWRKKLEGTYFHGWKAGPNKVVERESKHWSGQLSMHGAVMDTWIPRGWFKLEEKI